MTSVEFKSFIAYLYVGTLVTCSLCVDNGYEASEQGSNRASLATLQFVSIVARHGSRAPITTYPNDPYPYDDARFWPQGKGELTNFGKKQLFALGSRLRERYDAFLPALFYPNDTIPVYNPNNRDMDSASLLLAGLYPPVGSQVWNKQLLWQPIPSRVYDFDVCELLHNNKCPAYKIEAFKKAAIYGLELFHNSSCLMKYLSNNTGENVFTVLQLYQIMDPLLRQEENGFKLPEWTKSVYPKELKEIYTHIFNTLFAGSDKILKLTAGPELQHLVGYFNKKVNGSLSSNTRMYVELAHDCTLYSLLKAIGSDLGQQMIETSAYLVFELHKLYETYIVEAIYYRYSTDEDPTYINMKNCPSPCSLENFNKFIENLAGTENWEKACQKLSIF